MREEGVVGANQGILKDTERSAADADEAQQVVILFKLNIGRIY